MEKSDFLVQIERLRDTYGKRSYPDERVKMIWQAFKSYQFDDFQHGIGQLIGESNRPPMLPEFKATIRRTITVQDHGQCDVCDKNGFVSNKRDGISYVQRCTCGWGQELCDSIPTINIEESIREQTEEPQHTHEEVSRMVEGFIG